MTLERLTCLACGASLPGGARFCPECGTAVGRGCVGCGASLGPGDRFCPTCGMPQARLKANAPGDDGEHRRLTVMFCDMVQSTRLSTEMEPEALREVIRGYQANCASAIESAGGMVAQYLGDGVMAFFGYPVALEDAVARAVGAAADVIDGMPDLNARLATRHGIEVQVRIALHSGPTLVSSMGAGETRARHAATGTVPSIAARLQEHAPINGVVMTREVADRVATSFETRLLGSERLKGIPGPVEIHVLAGRRAIPRTRVTGHRIVGRERELAVLDQAWARVQQTSESAIVSLTAEPGLGKSALVARFLAGTGVGPRSCHVLTGLPSDRASPFASLWRMIASQAGVEARRRGALRTAARDWFVSHGGNDPAAVDALIGAQPRPRARGAEGGAGDDGDALRTMLFAAFRRHVARGGGPALVVLEDAHWIDPSTIEMVDAAVAERRALPPFLLLVASRPGTPYTWCAPVERSLELGGLDAEACRALIAEAAGGVDPDMALAAQVAKIASGVPLYVEELTRSLVERGLVREEAGRLRLRAIGAEMPTPGSLLDLLISRLDALGPAKALAQVASVLGRSVDADALAAVSGMAPWAVAEELRVLQRAGIMEETGEGIVEFRHALFQQAASDTLLRSRRAALHGAYLDWLEREGREAAPETLGYHAFGAGRFDAAAGHYRDAGVADGRANAQREAVAHFRRALDAHKASAGIEPDDKGLEIEVRLAGAMLAAEGPGAPETLEAYERAIETSEQVSESAWHFPAYWGWWRISSNFPEMTRRAGRIVAVADRMADPEFKLQAHHCMWANTFQVGALDETLEHAERGLELYRPGPSAEHGLIYGGHDARVCAHGQSALARWLKGAGDAVLPEIERAIGHGEALGHRGSLLHALDIAGTLHGYRRDARALAETAERLVRIGEAALIEEYAAKGRFLHGWAEGLAGDTEGGLAMMNRAFEML
ncbi:MAG: adenylate/guanylate cyclase domain-containing protein, partial [Pseudomonadota bacterium]